jgi:glycerate 2-kinase
MTSVVQNPQQLLKDMFAAAIDAVSPEHTIHQHLTNLSPIAGHTLVLCIGKAAAQMASVAEKVLLKTIGSKKCSGIVVTKHGNELPTKHFHVITAGHPDPDVHSTHAAHVMLEAASKLTAQDRMLVLMSGGASALTLSPADDLSFENIMAVNAELLRGGVDITSMNCVRKHISNFNGGRLAKAAGDAEVITFAVSDVPKDDPSVIGSGPTVPDSTTCQDAIDIIRKFELNVTTHIISHLAKPSAESIKADNATWHNKQSFTVIASNRHAINAAAEHARKLGIKAIIIDEPIVGDAAQEAKRFAEIVSAHSYKDKTITGPSVFIRGGEAIVKLPKNFEGKGGRVGHAALAYLLHDPNCFALFGATDGSDGTSGHRAILLSPGTLKTATTKGLNAAEHLSAYNSAAFFDIVGSALPEQPTGTNVNEIYMTFVA